MWWGDVDHGARQVTAAAELWIEWSRRGVLPEVLGGRQICSVRALGKSLGIHKHLETAEEKMESFSTWMLRRVKNTLIRTKKSFFVRKTSQKYILTELLATYSSSPCFSCLPYNLFSFTVQRRPDFCSSSTWFERALWGHKPKVSPINVSIAYICRHLSSFTRTADVYLIQRIY